MKENLEFSRDDNNLVLSDKNSSDISSGTEGSFFEEEDTNLLENKELYNKQNIINGSISFINKFEFMKKSNFIYHFYSNNTSIILLMNIISLILFILIICVKLISLFFFSTTKISNNLILCIFILIIPFLLLTLMKIISLYNNYKQVDKEDVNKDLMRLLIQKWNIYYSIGLILLSLNFVLKLITFDIFNYHYKVVLILEIIFIVLSSIIFCIMYYFTKSTNNNILFIHTIDIISFPLSISVLLSFVIINFTDQFNIFIYNSSIYCFLLSCISLLLMVYYNDILFSFLVLIYQISGIKNISFHNMSFELFSTLINLGFIIFMSIKYIRKGFVITNEDNNYTLIDEQFYSATEQSNN